MRELEQDVPVGLNVRFVTIGDREKADRFCGPYGAAHLCLPDGTKATYKAMGLGEFNLLEIFTNAALLARRAENKAAGFTQNWRETKIADGGQLPGAAAIDRAGTLRWIHRGTHPADLPPLAEMIAAARAALAL